MVNGHLNILMKWLGYREVQKTLFCTLLVIAVMMIVGLYHIVCIRNQQNRKLYEANQAKTNFLSQMSHDMRTPMNGILGLITLMRDKTSVEDMQDDFDQLELSAHYLLDLINDTLDVNKIEAGKLELHMKQINSEVLMRNILRHAQLMAKERKVKLNIHMPEIPKGEWIPVLADAGRVEQIFMNVISNAIKYSPNEGVVDLYMKTLTVTPDYIVDEYIIQDNGIGISEDFMPHLFENFSQEGRMNTERQNGTGLGLSIVKQLVDLMGGTVQVESQENVGTKVTLTMKYSVYKGERHSAAGKQETVQKKENHVYPNLIGKRILLCEDNALNRKIGVALLEKKGVLVTCVENGKLGVEQFLNSAINYFDLILMDIRMPVMDGIEAVKEIRASQRPDAESIPVVAMTANAFESDMEVCKNAGMNGYIAKPIEPERMYRIISKTLGG